MARAAKKNFLFTDEDVVPALEDLLAPIKAAIRPGAEPRVDPDTPPPPPLENDRRNDPPPYVPGETDGHGDQHRHPHPNPPADPGLGEGDDSDVANPDVPGSTPRHPHPKPERTPENPDGDPTPDPDETEPDIEDGEDEEDIPYSPRNPAEDNRPDPIAAGNDLRRELYTAQRGREQAELGQPVHIHHGEIIPKPVHHYEGRIRIVDAWQYPGTMVQAPEFVDRNWAGYGDYDPVRGIEPGPCLRVPTGYGTDTSVVTLCRIGDYIAQQEVRVARDQPGDLKVEVWERGQFERLFMAVN